MGHATAGSIGASISNLITYPLDLIITRLQIQRQLRDSTQEDHEEYESILDAAKKIYAQEGLSGLYTGVVQDTLKTAADSFLFFLVYNSLREARLRTRGRKYHLSVGDELGVGFIAGASAKFFTMPIGTIVTRMQTSSMSVDQSGLRKQPTVSEIAKGIREEKGIQGFWSGYSATLILTLNPSLTFLFFENLKLLLLPRSKRTSPPPMMTFFIAALSKALASTITYPFSLAKARAQASRKAPTSPESSSPEKSSHGATSKGNAALQRTIIGTVLEIAQNEGLSALYQGLSGEVLKGFFSHGITMLMKDAVHGLIIKLYFALLKLSRRYPGTDEMTAIVKERADSVTSFAKETAEVVAERTSAATEAVSEKSSEVIVLASETSKSATEYITQKSKSAAEYINEQSKTAAEFVGEKGQNAIDATQDLFGKVQETVTDQAAGIDEFVREYVGDDGDNE